MENEELTPRLPLFVYAYHGSSENGLEEGVIYDTDMAESVLVLIDRAKRSVTYGDLQAEERGVADEEFYKSIKVFMTKHYFNAEIAPGVKYGR